MRGSSRSLRSTMIIRSRAFSAIIASFSHWRAWATSLSRSTSCSACGASSSSVSTHSRPSSPACWALSEKSEPESRASIISTSRNGTPTSMAIFLRISTPSICSPAAPASRSNLARTRRMLKNSDFCDEVEPVRTIDQLRIT